MSANPPSDGEVNAAATVTVDGSPCRRSTRLAIFGGEWCSIPGSPRCRSATESSQRLLTSSGQVDQLDEQRIELINRRRVFPGPTRSRGSARQGVWLSFAAEVVIIVVMTVTTLADAKARFSELVASAEATHERTTITKNGRPAVVIISAEDLESLEETLAIMSDPELLSAVRDRAGEPAEPISKDDMLARIAARQA
jgi:antitoxin YefM